MTHFLLENNLGKFDGKLSLSKSDLSALVEGEV